MTYNNTIHSTIAHQVITTVVQKYEEQSHLL